eukprot:CAMPEP_0115859082 /NCGR_PEP_ID=MMETSP0287-20121206/16430_1 /TAXON_ID=412157 /ORGANISM="Chrysochromulina rotalis, Strain UIO044" /LENGTH=53 /DNA_ID=CAMNT_0003313367 /DNA_START=323 /DNA_END=484 /DNA_ORIENTATION=-
MATCVLHPKQNVGSSSKVVTQTPTRTSGQLSVAGGCSQQASSSAIWRLAGPFH